MRTYPAVRPPLFQNPLGHRWSVLWLAAACALVPWAPWAIVSQAVAGPQQRDAAPPPQAQGHWWDRTAPGRGRALPKSKYYSIRSDLTAEETQKWARHLDIMYEEFTRRLVQGGGLQRRSPEVLNVFIFARERDYLDTLRMQFGLNAMGSGGMFFITNRGGGLAFFTENLPHQRIAHVAQHEGFHQFAHAFFGNDLPPWLNEGLAEFFGECVVEDGKVIIGQASPAVLEAVRQAAAKGEHIPFTQLLQTDNDLWAVSVQAGTAALQYMQSWSMVHFLVYGDGNKYQGAFQRMLKMVNSGTRSYEAMRQAFGLATEADVRDFEQRWVAHAVAAKPSSYMSARSRLEFLAEGLRTLWQRGQRPANLDGLRTALVEENFSFPVGTHGYTMLLKASDAKNFEVPQDATHRKPIALEMVPTPAPRGGPAKELEEKHPTPPVIRTKGLQPRELRVQWKRRADSPGEWDYEIVGGKG